jgi:DNA-binding GntR family transcriptional regulator
MISPNGKARDYRGDSTQPAGVVVRPASRRTHVTNRASAEEPRLLLRRPDAADGELRHHPSLKDMASDHIRMAIVTGELRPDTKVDQDDIADRLGISRLPVREALIELAAKGYVTSVPRRGAFVVRLTRQDIADHFQVLGALFAITASRAAEAIDAEQLALLRELHREIVDTRDPDRSQALDVDFHRTINRIGSSARLVAALQYFALALPNDYYMFSSHRRETEDHFRAALLDALDSGDPAAAAAVAQEHLRTCGGLTISALEARGYWANESADATGS